MIRRDKRGIKTDEIPANEQQYTFRVQLSERVQAPVVDVRVRPVVRGRRTRAREMRLQVGEVQRRSASVARPVLDGRSRGTSGLRHGVLGCGSLRREVADSQRTRRSGRLVPVPRVQVDITIYGRLRAIKLPFELSR